MYRRGDKCRQRPWGLVCHFSICLNSCSWSRAKGDKRMQQLNHSYLGNRYFVVSSIHFSVLEPAEVREQGMPLAAVLIISLLVHAELYFSGNTWKKHLKSCPWSRELDHTRVLLWNFFSEKMAQASSKRVTWGVCCSEGSVAADALSTKLTFPAPMAVPGAEAADCQLPGTLLSRLLCWINVDLKLEESRILFITAL